jgi:hypothetical protein
LRTCLKSIIYYSLTQFKEWLVIKNTKSIIEKTVFIFEKSKQILILFIKVIKKIDSFEEDLVTSVVCAAD